MKMVEIKTKFTNKVIEYLNKGWIINPESMSGSQGEDAKIDLTKGNELIRIWMDRESGSFFGEDNFHGYTLKIRVGKWQREAKDSTWKTVWLNELDIIEELSFYEINRHAWYVETLEEAMDRQRKKYSRYKYNMRVTSSNDITNEKTKQIAGKYLKNRKGYQRINWDDIKVKKTESGYIICYHGNTYHI